MPKPDQDARWLVVYSFALSFLIGIPRLFTVAVSDSLFLVYFDSSWIPLAYIGRAVLIPILGAAALALEKRFQNAKLLYGILVLLIMVQALFLAVFSATNSRWPYLGLLVWASVEWSLTSIVFWNTANRLFNVRQAKRYFGLIGSGEVASAVLGGFLVPALLRFASPVELLYASIAGLAGALCLLVLINKQFRDTEAGPAATRAMAAVKSTIADFFADPYIAGLILIVSLYYCAHCFTDNAFYQQVQLRYKDPEEITSFLGAFLALLGLATLLFNTVATRAWIQFAGVTGAALTTPLAILAGACFVVVAGFAPGLQGLVFIGMVATKFIQRLLTEGLHRPVYYLLFQPVDPAIRTRAQNFSESIPGRFAGGVAGLLLILAGKLLPFTAPVLCVFLALISIGWIIASVRVGNGYQSMLRGNVRRHFELYPEAESAEGSFDPRKALERAALVLCLVEKSRGEGGVSALFAMAARELSRRTKGELLDHLARRYPAEEFGRMREYYFSSSPQCRAIVIELIDTACSAQERKNILPYLEAEGDRKELLALGKRVSPLARSACEDPKALLEHPLLADEGFIRECISLNFGLPLPRARRLAIELGGLLKRVAIFRDIPLEILAKIVGRMRRMDFQAGDAILRKGDRGDTLYIIARGRVRVHDGPVCLEEMASGGFFGEYAALIPRNRSADVTALEPTTALVLSQQTLYSMMDRFPDVPGLICKVLATRLAKTPYLRLGKGTERVAAPFDRGRDSIAELLSKATYFSALERAYLEMVEPYCALRPFSAGDEILGAGEMVNGSMLILHGAVGTLDPATGESVLLSSGAWLGDALFFSGSASGAPWRGAGDGVMLSVQGQVLQGLMRCHEGFVRACVESLIERLVRVNELSRKEG